MHIQTNVIAKIENDKGVEIVRGVLKEVVEEISGDLYYIFLPLWLFKINDECLVNPANMDYGSYNAALADFKQNASNDTSVYGKALFARSDMLAQAYDSQYSKLIYHSGTSRTLRSRHLVPVDVVLKMESNNFEFNTVAIKEKLIEVCETVLQFTIEHD